MVKTTMDIRLKAVFFYSEENKTAKEVAQMYNLSERTVRRWHKAYTEGGFESLTPKKTTPKSFSRNTPEHLKNRIISIKRRFPA